MKQAVLTVLIFILAVLLTLAALGARIGEPEPKPQAEPSPAPTPQELQPRAGSDGKLTLSVLTPEGEITQVTLADYLVGVVAAEAPASFETEALRAQAVAAHTWAAYRAAHPDASLGGADFEADPSHDCGYVTKEVYNGIE